MDGLPTDVVDIILRKLAEQDPLSLLQATCACKALLNLASEKIWRHAFLAPLPAEENALGLEESTELDGTVESMGGYKRLALVKGRYRRASKKHSTNLNKRIEKVPRIKVEGATQVLRASPSPPPKIVARYLFVYKLRGKKSFGDRPCVTTD